MLFNSCFFCIFWVFVLCLRRLKSTQASLIWNRYRQSGCASLFLQIIAFLSPLLSPLAGLQERHHELVLVCRKGRRHWELVSLWPECLQHWRPAQLQPPQAAHVSVKCGAEECVYGCSSDVHFRCCKPLLFFFFSVKPLAPFQNRTCSQGVLLIPTRPFFFGSFFFFITSPNYVL